MRFLRFLIPLLLCLTMFAQDAKKLDSIQRLLRKDSNNTSALLALAQLMQADLDTDYYLSNKVIEIATRKHNFRDLAFATNRIGVLYFFAGEYDTALVYCRKTYSIASKHMLHYIAAKALTNIGQIYVVTDQTKKAIDTLLLGREHLEQEADVQLQREQQSKLEYLLGEAYSHLGAYEEAVKTLLSLKALYDTHPTLPGYGNALTGLGNTYLLMGDYLKALQYHHLASTFYEKEKDDRNSLKAFYNLAHVHHVNSNLDSALYWYKVALQKNTEFKDDAQLPFLYELRANIFRDRKQPDSALVYYDNAIALHKAAGSDGRVGECYYEIGNLYYNQGNFAQAQKYFTIAFPTFRDLDFVEEAQNTCLLLARTEVALENCRQAVQYYEDYDSLRTMLYSEEKIDAITRQEVKYETSIKEAKIAKQQSEIKLRTRQNYWLLGGTTFATLAFVTIGFSYRRIRKQKAIIAQQKQEILHNNRNSIQQLISIFGRQGEEEGYREKAEANQERLFTLNLLNGLLYENKGAKQLDLQTYLQKLCDAKQISYNMPISLKAQSMAVKADLLKDVGLIVNELTTNAGKYGAADAGTPGSVDIAVERTTDQRLKITFRDKGKGLPDDFSLLAARQSFGLSFVQDLVQQHHGEIKAYNDHGACFEITLKL